MLDRLKRILFEGTNIKQLPGTKHLDVGDRVTHPDHEGEMKIFSLPMKTPNTKIAFVYPSHINRPMPHELIRIENPERLKVVND